MIENLQAKLQCAELCLELGLANSQQLRSCLGGQRSLLGAPRYDRGSAQAKLQQASLRLEMSHHVRADAGTLALTVVQGRGRALRRGSVRSRKAQ